MSNVCGGGPELNNPGTKSHLANFLTTDKHRWFCGRVGPFSRGSIIADVELPEAQTAIVVSLQLLARMQSVDL